jgi:hypothetical protein
VIIAAKQSISLSDIHIGCFSLTVKVKVENTMPQWWLTSVYGPQPDGQKDLFLEELAAIKGSCPGPWLIIGDFNLILSAADKNNQHINRRNLQNFRRTVDELELQDLHLHGRLYTWSNERDNPTLVKLDRALASLDWDHQFPSCHLQALSSDASDHCPLLLQTNVIPAAKPRFHFEVFWPKFEGYMEAVESGCPDSITDPYRRLDNLFRNTIKQLQSWAAKRIGQIKTQLLAAREIILKLDQHRSNGSSPRKKWHCGGVSNIVVLGLRRWKELSQGKGPEFCISVMGMRTQNSFISWPEEGSEKTTSQALFMVHTLHICRMTLRRSSAITSLTSLGKRR